MLYPASFVKKLIITVILNKNLSDSEGQSVRSVVTEILSMDQARGDELVIIKAPFAPFWRTIWYTPESMGLVFKYGVLTLMAIIAMIVVAVGFLKLAGAMNTMAKAQQGHQITMDLGKGLPGMPGGHEPVSKVFVSPGEQDQDENGGAGTVPGAVVFEVKMEKVPYLVKMMSGEDPANVALVAAHLPQEVRNEFFKRLPSAFASDVMINMAMIRFIEPEIIATLKDELERRLSGAVGGLDGVLGAIGNVSLQAKRTMLEELRQKQPELAAEVRSHILLPDDLGLLAERDFSVLLSAVKVGEWATALFGLPEAVKTKLKNQMADKTWQMVEQSMKYGTPSMEKTEEAVEHIMEAAAAMMKEGRIVNPLKASSPQIDDKSPAAEGETAAQPAP
jgi:hypothetical protein